MMGQFPPAAMVHHTVVHIMMGQLPCIMVHLFTLVEYKYCNVPNTCYGSLLAREFQAPMGAYSDTTVSTCTRVVLPHLCRQQIAVRNTDDVFWCIGCIVIIMHGYSTTVLT